MKPNSLAFIALANEFCSTLEQMTVSPVERTEFVTSMLNYIPRLYISATDLASVDAEAGEDMLGDIFFEEAAIDDRLDEEHYDAVRRAVEAVMGGDDVYLEVFEEDMKYSDTPVSASVSEGLSDMFQSLYNFIETVRDAPEERAEQILEAASEDFRQYWSRIACNLMRALNHIRYYQPDNE